MAILHWFPALLFAAAIFYFSHQSSPPGGAIWNENLLYLMHSAAYATLALTMVWGASRGLRRRLGTRSLLIVLAAASLYGVSDELHQALVPGRTMSILDWIADTLGAAVALWAFSSLQPRLIRQS